MEQNLTLLLTMGEDAAEAVELRRSRRSVGFRRAGSLQIGLGLALSLLIGRDAAAEPGDHIRTGQAEIIPSVELGGEWRSNVYLEEGLVGDGESEVDPGVALTLQPKLEIDVKGEDVVLDFDAAYQAKKYVTPGLSNLDRFTDFGVGAGLTLLPDALLGFKLQERLTYLGYESEATLAEHAYTSHLMNESIGKVSIHPGGALELDVGGSFHYDDYNVPSVTNVNQTNDLNERIGYGPIFNGQWKFLPKTAVVTNFYYRWYQWRNNLLNALGDEGTSTDAGIIIALPDFIEWQAEAGIRGRFTERLVLEALVGYGQMIYDEASVDEAAANLNQDVDPFTDFAEGDYTEDLTGFPDGFTTTLALAYTPQEGHELSVGYRKNFQDAYFTNYMAYHYVYMRYEGLFAERFIVQPEFAYRYEDFHGELTRQDHVIISKLDFGYAMTDYLTAGTGVWWTQRASADANHPEIEYDDVNVHLNLTFVY